MPRRHQAVRKTLTDGLVETVGRDAARPSYAAPWQYWPCVGFSSRELDPLRWAAASAFLTRSRNSSSSRYCTSSESR
jgi:hypothetical protein